jgi:hypothetical protein
MYDPYCATACRIIRARDKLFFTKERENKYFNVHLRNLIIKMHSNIITRIEEIHLLNSRTKYSVKLVSQA